LYVFPLSHTRLFSLSLLFSLFFVAHVSVSFSVVVHLSFSLSLCCCSSLFLSVSIYLSLSLSLSLFLSVSLSLCLSLSLYQEFDNAEGEECSGASSPLCSFLEGN